MFNFKIKINNEHKIQSKVRNEHRFSITSLEATIIVHLVEVIKYSCKTSISKAVLLVRTIGSTSSYKMSQSKVTAKVKAKTLLNTVRYIGSTSLKEKAWLKADGKLRQSLASNLKEKMMARALTRSNEYRHTTKITKESLNIRAMANTTYASITTAIAHVYVGISGMLRFRSRTEATARARVRALCTSIVNGSTTKIKTICGVNGRANLNSFTQSTRLTKDGVNVRFITDTTKYISTLMSNKANLILAKLSLITNFSSKTNIDKEKMYQYYVVKLNSYKDQKLNEVPNELLKFCYVIDKNWSVISKIYKTWDGIKDRVISWGDFK